MKKAVCDKIFIVLICIITFVAIIPSSALADTLEPELYLIDFFEGAGIAIETSVHADAEQLSNLKEYICIFGADNKLKSIAIVKPKTDITVTTIKGNFDTKTDYIRIFLWDDNLQPYSDGKPTLLKNIKHTPRHYDGSGWGGSGSVSSGGQMK